MLKDVPTPQFDCFQWWKELGQKKQQRSTEDIKANNIKSAVSRAKEHMLWMEQNNYVGNN